MVRRLGTVCLLALLWAVARCAADQPQLSAGRQPDGDAANLLMSLIARAVKEAVEPISAELSSQRTLLGSLDARMELVMKRLDMAMSFVSQLETANIRLDSVSNQLDGLANCTQPGPDALPRDCSELPVGSSSGVHLLQLSSNSPRVESYCDMVTDGGGWTVVQRRGDIQPREDFFRDWASYRSGFGNLTGEFWWGLEKLWIMTYRRDRRFKLRVDLENFDSEKRHALYQNVSVSPESDGFRLTGGKYTGSAGDSLSYHFGQKFSTKDRDQDNGTTRHCAEFGMGGWWYHNCYAANLNGLYLTARVTDDDEKRDVVWREFGGFNRPLKTVEMKIRPITP